MVTQNTQSSPHSLMPQQFHKNTKTQLSSLYNIKTKQKIQWHPSSLYNMKRNTKKHNSSPRAGSINKIPCAPPLHHPNRTQPDLYSPRLDSCPSSSSFQLYPSSSSTILPWLPNPAYSWLRPTLVFSIAAGSWELGISSISSLAAGTGSWCRVNVCCNSLPNSSS